MHNNIKNWKRSRKVELNIKAGNIVASLTQSSRRNTTFPFLAKKEGIPEIEKIERWSILSDKRFFLSAQFIEKQGLKKLQRCMSGNSQAAKVNCKVVPWKLAVQRKWKLCKYNHDPRQT